MPIYIGGLAKAVGLDFRPLHVIQAETDHLIAPFRELESSQKRFENPVSQQTLGRATGCFRQPRVATSLNHS
jgi:hypothetical protein